ncbi:DUF4225 domain-containing protein [Photorhabdus tasmaniensis]|uniref:DUF4225 domain-containing protein n=1 Tax=Photorhabdus sp. RM323S TaxID=3342828 RepID=UPI0036DC2B19
MEQDKLLSLKVRELRELARTLSFRYISHSKIKYGVFRKVLKPREKSWSLFRNINNDFTRGWKEMDIISLSTEVTADSYTAWGIYKIQKEKE